MGPREADTDSLESCGRALLTSVVKSVQGTDYGVLWAFFLKLKFIDTLGIVYVEERILYLSIFCMDCLNVFMLPTFQYSQLGISLLPPRLLPSLFQTSFVFRTLSLSLTYKVLCL